MRIFISHSSADNDFCHRLVAALAAYPAVDVWYDQNNIEHGDKITDEIMTEIRSRPISIFILSPSALQSGWVRLEARVIVEQDVRDPSRMILSITAQSLTSEEFTGIWAAIEGIKCIESPHAYQPVEEEEIIQHLLWRLAFEERPQGEETLAQEKAADLVKRAPPLLALSEYGKALDLLNLAIRGDSALFTAWYLKGEAHMGLADLGDEGNKCMAHESFMRSVFLSQASDKEKRAQLLPVAYYGEGRALMKLIRYADARKDFRRAVTLDPGYADAWVGLGQARAHLGFRWRALKAFDAAIAKDHLTSSAYYGKAATLQDLHRLKKALDALEQTIALDINNSSAWRQKADLLARMSARFDEADDAYHALLKLDSQNAGHWKQLGMLHMQRFGKTPHELTALAWTNVVAEREAPLCLWKDSA